MLKHTVPALFFAIVFFAPGSAQAAGALNLPAANPRNQSLVPILPTVLGASQSASGEVASRLGKAHTAEDGSMTIKPPRDWNLEEESIYYSDGTMVAVSDPAGEASIFLTVSGSEFPNPTLRNLIAETRNTLCECEYVIVSERHVRIGRHRAYLFDTCYEDDIRQQFIVFAANGKGYGAVLTAPTEAWDSYEPVMMRSLRTLKVR